MTCEVPEILSNLRDFVHIGLYILKRCMHLEDNLKE